MESIYRVLAVTVLALIIATPFLSTSIVYSEETVSEETIMLETARAAVVLVVTIPHAWIIWEEQLELFSRVGIEQPIYVETAMFGTGFFVSPDGYIITNGHVVNEFESDLEEKLPLLLELVNVFAEAYYKTFNEPPSNELLNALFREAVAAYLANRLRIQDYSVDVYVGVGKVATGIGNIRKFYPARIVEATPFEKEDLALIKIEVQHAPSLKISSDQVKVGETVWVLGYPGAVTFHELLSTSTMMVPTITKGMVSGYREKTTGITVLQSDVNVNHGNSGGPMVNSKGEVVAVVSFGSIDPTGSGREVPGFNFFIPSKYVLELLSRNNVNNVQDPVMKLYEEGLRLYYAKHYSAAIEKFKMVKDLYSGFPFVDDYIANAQAAILHGEDVPLGPKIDTMMIIGLAAVTVVGGGAAFFFIKKRRSKAGATTPAPYTTVQQIQQQPTTQQYSFPGQVSQPQTYQTTSAPQQQMTIKYCWNCGRAIPADAKICPYCGASQEE